MTGGFNTRSHAFRQTKHLRLTKAEVKTYELMQAGKKPDEIAEALGINRATVLARINVINEKLR